MKQLFAGLFVQTILGLAGASAQIPFSDSRWIIKAKEAKEETYEGKQCLKIIDGTATLPAAHFANGEISFDMAITHARYFPGIGFRMQDSANGEMFYVRPHQSGNPDALQYYPEFNGDGGWQLYYGEGFNRAQVLPFDQWIHVKILVGGHRAEVWFDGQLALNIRQLMRPEKQGMIILENTSAEAARYANFSYMSTDTVTLGPPPARAASLPPSMVTLWKISSPFDEELLKKGFALPLSALDTLSWTDFSTDDRGIADLSRLAGTAKGRNTVLGRLVLQADQDTIRQLSFGFSDRARVYLNGRLLYEGKDEFMSRDYRFLGTIGFYDALFLPLKKGANELIIAVSEDFGGWGLTARLE